MLFSERERAAGNAIFFTSNRIQYLTNADKLNYYVQLVDRGLITLNEARDAWQLPPVDGGDVRIIRGEYYNADDKTQVNGDDENADAK